MWNNVLDVDRQVGSLHLEMHHDWIARATTKWLHPCTKLVIHRLSFEWTGHDLYRFRVTGLDKDTNNIALVATFDDNLKPSKKPRAASDGDDDDSEDWAALGNKKKRCGSTAAPKQKSTRKTSGEAAKAGRRHAQQSAPIRTEVEEADIPTTIPNDNTFDDFTTELAVTLLGEAATTAIRKNIHGVVNAAEVHYDGDGGDEENNDAGDNTVPESEIPDLSTLKTMPPVPPRPMTRPIERIPAPPAIFSRDPGEVKTNVVIDASNRIWYDQSDRSGDNVKLLTMWWFGEHTVKIDCALHGSRCNMFINGRGCWEQVRGEIDEFAALAASYNPSVEDGGAMHHYDSARAAEKRCREISHIVKEDNAAQGAARKAIAAKATAKSKENKKLQKDLKAAEREMKQTNKQLQQEIEKLKKGTKAALKDIPKPSKSGGSRS